MPHSDPQRVFVVLMGPRVPLHGATPESSGHAAHLTCSPGKNWDCKPGFRAGRAVPAQDSLPDAFLFPKPQQKWACDNMAPQCLRQAKIKADKVNFPASAMDSVGYIYTVLAWLSVAPALGRVACLTRVLPVTLRYLEFGSLQPLHHSRLPSAPKVVGIKHAYNVHRLRV